MWILRLYSLFLICLLVIAQQCPCGKRIGAKRELYNITNGQTVNDPTKYPWMAQVSFYDSYRKRSVCSGSIIGSRWVITSAYCVRNINMKIFVHVGDVTLQNSLNGAYKAVPSIPYFEQGIAILRLDRPLTFSASVQPICLPSSKFVNYTDVFTTAGWGFLRHDGPPAPILQESNLIENQSCYQKIYNQTQICAQIIDEKSTCNLDSGGPLMYEMNGTFNLVGVTKDIIRPYKCGTKEANIIFARVSSFIDWINQHIGREC